jgi:hypothetical protein
MIRSGFPVIIRVFAPAASACLTNPALEPSVCTRTDAAFAEARQFCIDNHVVVEDACWFTGIYSRVLPSHAIGSAGRLQPGRQIFGALVEEVRFARDSQVEGGGFEPPVPRQRRHPSATANHLSEPRRPVFKIELKPRRSAMTLSLPANRCTGHVILGLDRLTRHARLLPRPSQPEPNRSLAMFRDSHMGPPSPRSEHY